MTPPPPLPLPSFSPSHCPCSCACQLWWRGLLRLPSEISTQCHTHTRTHTHTHHTHTRYTTLISDVMCDLDGWDLSRHPSHIAPHDMISGTPSSRHLEVVFCYSLIERNKRLVLQAPEPSSLPEAQKLQSRLSVSSLLDCFFPFDPYCLARWVGHV